VAVQPGKDGEQRSETRVIVRQRFLDLDKCAPLAGRQAHRGVLPGGTGSSAACLARAGT
jgi:hypothetical protein